MVGLMRWLVAAEIQIIIGMRSHPDFKEAQTTVEFLLGPVKIKDGLFMGDQLAARDIEFIVSNKVTHVINTVSKAVPNLYERFGVQYLSVHWSEKEENIFDRKNNATNAIFTFIEEAMEQGESCLVHSLHGKSRACAVLAAYLMRRYSWSLNKALELLNAKKEGLEVRSNYLAQMQELEARMLETTKLSYTWTEVRGEEDQLLSNTFNNSKKAKPEPYVRRQPTKKVTWDEKPAQRYNVTFAMTMNRGVLRQRDTPKIKSILKGFPNEDQTKEDRSENPILTVNNFMQTEKKPEQQTTFNSRPYSSDNKERKANQYDPKQGLYEVKPSRLFGYQPPLETNLKIAYQSKLASKVGGKMLRQQPKRVTVGADRPQSANIVGQRKKVREQLVVGGVAKKRYPSTNARDQSGRTR